MERIKTPTRRIEASLVEIKEIEEKIKNIKKELGELLETEETRQLNKDAEFEDSFIE